VTLQTGILSFRYEKGQYRFFQKLYKPLAKMKAFRLQPFLKNSG
jgi:hypothetical protein